MRATVSRRARTSSYGVSSRRELYEADKIKARRARRSETCIASPRLRRGRVYAESLEDLVFETGFVRTSTVVVAAGRLSLTVQQRPLHQRQRAVHLAFVRVARGVRARSCVTLAWIRSEFGGGPGRTFNEKKNKKKEEKEIVDLGSLSF